MQHPYPTEDEKRAIAAQTNLTLLQVIYKNTFYVVFFSIEISKFNKSNFRLIIGL